MAKMSKKKLSILIVVLLLLCAGGFMFYRSQQKEPVANAPASSAPSNDAQQITSYAECVAAGNPVMQSYPEQCAANGQTFVNNSQPGSDNPPITDEMYIREAIISYCAGLGAQDTKAAANIVDANMQDPNLFVLEGNYARLSAGCGEGEGGFRSFLHKSSGVWSILGQGQMNTIGCNVLDGTGISAKIATTCFDEAGEERAIN